MPPRAYDDENKGLTAGDRVALLKALHDKIIAIGAIGGVLFGGLGVLSVPVEAVRKAEGFHLANTGKALSGVGARPASELLYVGGQALYALVESRQRWFFYVVPLLLGFWLLFDASNPQWAEMTSRWKYAYFTAIISLWGLLAIYSYMSKRYSLSASVLLIFMLASAGVEAGAVFTYNETTASYANTHVVAMMVYIGVVAIAFLDLAALWMQRINGWGKAADISSSSGVTVE